MTDSEKLDLILKQQEEILSLLRDVKPVQGTRWKEQPLPEDWEKWCIESRPDLDPVSVYKDFQSYWLSTGGKKAIKVDWFRTWQTWCRRQKAQEKRVADWKTSDVALAREASKIGLTPRAGESWEDLRRRYEEAIR